jgi:hypothetical protein
MQCQRIYLMQLGGHHHFCGFFQAREGFFDTGFKLIRCYPFEQIAPPYR